MKLNKKLSIIAVILFPVAVISFAFRRCETNFNLEKSYGPEIPLVKNEDMSEKMTVRLSLSGSIEVMDLEEYIVGVVAGEMPASFEVEALKAQAVASRTYALYKKKQNEKGEYDLTDNTNTQVYISLDAMKKKWDKDFELYFERVKKAVDETKGQIIMYGGEPIESFYFAMSGGYTQDAGYVFNENRDYLKPVESKYDNELLKNYEVVTEFTYADFVNKLGLECSTPVVDKVERNEYGYVNEIGVCDKVFKGTNFRAALGLRSTNLTIEISDRVKVTTHGYGHGVGMSQYGANGYAKVGYTYVDILKHYYSGVEIGQIKDV